MKAGPSYPIDGACNPLSVHGSEGTGHRDCRPRASRGDVPIEEDPPGGKCPLEIEGAPCSPVSGKSHYLFLLTFTAYLRKRNIAS